MASKFFKCELCRNVVGLIRQGRGQLVCCGKPMIELTANTTDAAQEKHVPVPEYNKAEQKVTVKVGSAAHPMTAEHFIEWIHLQTKNGAQMCHLTPDSAPEAEFRLAPGDEPVAVFAYCNLHGLWKAEV